MRRLPEEYRAIPVIRLIRKFCIKNNKFASRKGSYDEQLLARRLCNVQKYITSSQKELTSELIRKYGSIEQKRAKNLL